MMDCVFVCNMRMSDAHTIAHFASGRELMYRAAWGVSRAVNWHGKTAIVTGSGNNGGDGFALACILKDRQAECTVFTLSSHHTPDGAYYAAMAQSAGVEISPFYDGCLNGYDIIVDCLLGTGFQGNVRESYANVIRQINSSDAYVVSVDINSGMNGDSGEAELSVVSDLTVTIGFVKQGLISPNAGKYMKKLICTDIGIQLLQQEGKLCSKDQWLCLCRDNGIPPEQKELHLAGIRYLPSPAWLDMRIISAIE